MAGSRLIVHAGTHKTGTTFIQNSLAHASAALEGHGLHFPRMGRAAGQHGLTALWADRMRPYAAPEECEAQWQQVAEAAGRFDNVLISSEEFSSAHAQRLDLDAVRRRVPGYDHITVVCFVRNQVDLLQSVYCEVSKGKAPPPALPPEFLHTALATGIACNIAADFNILDREVFAGVDDLRFVDYARACAHPQGLVGALLEAAGLDAGIAAEVEPADHMRSNRSPNPLAVWAANLVRGDRPPSPQVLASCERLVAAHLDGRPSLFEQAERQRIVDHFAPLNAAFEARVRVRQPGFAMTPYALGAARVSRGALTARFWSHLARDLFHAKLVA